MSVIFKRGPSEIRSDLTPMIDVTFLLIVFFVLVSQIVEVESVDLTLPELPEPATSLPGEEQRAVINVVPGAGGRIESYRVGGFEFPGSDSGLAALRDHLRNLLGANPALRINLRADQRTHFEFVEPVLQAVAGAGRGLGPGSPAPRVNLVVVREE